MSSAPVLITVNELMLRSTFGELTERVYEVFKKYGSLYSETVKFYLYTALEEDHLEEVLHLLEKFANENPGILNKDCDQDIRVLFNRIYSDVLELESVYS